MHPTKDGEEQRKTSLQVIALYVFTFSIAAAALYFLVNPLNTNISPKYLVYVIGVCAICVLFAYLSDRFPDLALGFKDWFFKLNNRNATEYAFRIAQQLKEIDEQGSIHSHPEAYVAALKKVEEIIVKYKPFYIEIKFIIVVMRFTLQEFKKDKDNQLVNLMRTYPDTRFDILITYVEPEYFSRYQIESEEEFNWKESSVALPIELGKLREEWKKKDYKVNLNFYPYETIPQRHGFIIQNEHLFLSQVDWKIDGGKVRISAGENQYRYYNDTNLAGKRQIRLFRNWFSIYSKFYSYYQPPIK